MSIDPQWANHRSHPRFAKMFSVSYKIKGSAKCDISNIKDISRGGIRFTSAYKIEPKTVLTLELRIPALAPRITVLEGAVVGVNEISANMVYEIRVKFVNLSQAEINDLDKIVK